MIRCHLCESAKTVELLDFGPQPICNRFLVDPTFDETTFPLGLSQCQDCGLLQLTAPIAAHDLVPPYDWITYTETEDHLDGLVYEILNTTDLPKDARIFGISYKDASTLERFKEKGFEHAIQFDPAGDLGIISHCAGIETIQHRLTAERAKALTEQYGKAHLVITRHILEHAHDLNAFVDALRTLLKPGGFLVLEVPDFTNSLSHLDYSTLWEEHTAYFTPATFRWSFAQLGFELLHDIQYPYPLENALVGIAQWREDIRISRTPGTGLAEELKQARSYADAFPAKKEAVATALASEKQSGKPIAIFGAGHLACTFINLLGVAEHIDFVVDDHPNKKNLYMPGSKTPIYGSASPVDKGVGLCLFGLDPKNEKKVLERSQTFLDKGGRFASIFPASPIALKID